MFFQKVLKGVPGLTNDDANVALRAGLLCNWWRRVGTINPVQIADKLTEANLYWHLEHYDDADPLNGGAPFRENTPFISVTAGSVERAAFLQRNIVFDPFVTALLFATNGFRAYGHVFYAYVFTLGRQSIPLVEFAEEVRELNIYKYYLRFHPEGEITAKIEIRGRQIERWEGYDGPAALAALRTAATPQPAASGVNFNYEPPERYCNIRGLVTD
jgi:hypothetical protein